MPPPPPPPGYSNESAVVGSPRNGLGIASLVLGILSILTGLFVVGIVFGLIGLILGFVGRRRVKRGEATNGGVALAGIITSIIGILVAGAIIVFAIIFADDFSNLADCLDDAGDDQSAIEQCQEDFTDEFGG